MDSLLGPPLHQFHLASHLIWAVATIAWVALVVMGLAEAYDWLRERWGSRHHGEDAHES